MGERESLAAGDQQEARRRTAESWPGEAQGAPHFLGKELRQPTPCAVLLGHSQTQHAGFQPGAVTRLLCPHTPKPDSQKESSHPARTGVCANE